MRRFAICALHLIFIGKCIQGDAKGETETVEKIRNTYILVKKPQCKRAVGRPTNRQ
jgi:hypothetical protein